jgi:hypothetical protein
LFRPARPSAARARPAFRSTPNGARITPESLDFRFQFTQPMMDVLGE